MPAVGRHDKSLNRLLADFADRLAASGNGFFLVRPDDLANAEQDCLGILRDVGLLISAEPAMTTICDGCDRACPMEVQFLPDRGALPKRAFIVCDKRDDIGRVQVELDRLCQWRVSLDQLANTIAALLGTDRPPKPLDVGLAWTLGCIDHDGESVEIILDAAGGNKQPYQGLTVTLVALSEIQDMPIAELTRLISFKHHRLSVNRTVLECVLIGRFHDSRVACEIRYERRDIVLVNHVTGGRRTIASPNFNSSNDNAFQVLYDNPGKTYSLAELRAAADEPTIPDLHKVVENLKFDGALKKLFFNVSKNAIRFDRTATLGQMAILSISPQDIR